MSVLKEFNQDEGVYISAEEAAALVKETHQIKKDEGKERDSYLHSQFFGKEKLLKLINGAGESCVGIKISLILEGDKDDEEGLLIQVVDKEGNILGDQEKEPSGGGGGIALFGGPKCPRTCMPPPTEED